MWVRGAKPPETWEIFWKIISENSNFLANFILYFSIFPVSEGERLPFHCLCLYIFLVWGEGRSLRSPSLRHWDKHIFEMKWNEIVLILCEFRKKTNNGMEYIILKSNLNKEPAIRYKFELRGFCTSPQNLCWTSTFRTTMSHALCNVARCWII